MFVETETGLVDACNLGVLFFRCHFLRGVQQLTSCLGVELNEIANMPKAPVYVVKSMSLKEQRLIKDLMRKYGEDVEVTSCCIYFLPPPPDPIASVGDVASWK